MSAAGFAAGLEAAPPGRSVAVRRGESASASPQESFPSSPSSSQASPVQAPDAVAQVVAAQSAPVIRSQVLDRPRGRVVVTSHPTQTYNAHGKFPALKVFQYARPLPEARPFGRLGVEPGTEGTRQMLAGSYGRSREASSRFVDSLQ